MTLNFTIEQVRGGHYDGMWFVFHKNRLGIASLWLRTDGSVGDDADLNRLDMFFFASREDAEDAVTRFEKYF